MVVVVNLQKYFGDGGGGGGGCGKTIYVIVLVERR